MLGNQLGNFPGIPSMRKICDKNFFSSSSKRSGSSEDTEGSLPSSVAEASPAEELLVSESGGVLLPQAANERIRSKTAPKQKNFFIWYHPF